MPTSFAGGNMRQCPSVRAKSHHRVGRSLRAAVASLVWILGPPARASGQSECDGSWAFCEPFDILSTAVWLEDSNSSGGSWSIVGGSLVIDSGTGDGAGAWVLSRRTFARDTEGLLALETRARVYQQPAGGPDGLGFGLWSDGYHGAVFQLRHEGIYGAARNGTAPWQDVRLGGDDPTQWHDYRLVLSRGVVSFSVDGELRGSLAGAAVPSESRMFIRLDKSSGGPARLGSFAFVRVMPLQGGSGSAGLWSTDGPVYAVARSGNTVYLGGEFTQVGPAQGNGGAESAAVVAGASVRGIEGVPRNNLAALNATTGEAMPWDPGANGIVKALAVANGTVYVGGLFTSVAGETRNRLAALDAVTGALRPWDPDANGAVRAMVIVGGTLYAGGGFTFVGGQARNRLVALDLMSGAITSWNPNAGRTVRAMAVSGSTLYLGGEFTSLGGRGRNRLAAVNVATGAVADWHPDADSTVYALAVSGESIYAGGDFVTLGGQPRGRIGCMSAASGLVDAWQPQVNGTVLALATFGGTVYVGGSFTTFAGQPRRYVAALDASSDELTSWNPGVLGGWHVPGIYALTVNGEDVYLGGDFTEVAGQLQGGIAAIPRLQVRSAVSPPPHVTEMPIRLTASGPNPATQDVAVGFSVPEVSWVRAGVYDAAGRLIRVLEDGRQAAGEHTLTWQGRDAQGNRVASGVYFVRLVGGGGTAVRKVVLAR
ncbi:MAG: FlgD immunoglobulin-like domain containing protein [bacterium]